MKYQSISIYKILLLPLPCLDHDGQIAVASVDEAELDAALGIQRDNGGSVDADETPSGGQGDEVQRTSEGAAPGELAVVHNVSDGIGVGLFHADAARLARSDGMVKVTLHHDGIRVSRV